MMRVKLKIRTKYQRARVAVEIAYLLRKHSDPKVVAKAMAISMVLGAPIELVNAEMVKYANIDPAIIAALPDDCKEEVR